LWFVTSYVSHTTAAHNINNCALLQYSPYRICTVVLITAQRTFPETLNAKKKMRV